MNDSSLLRTSKITGKTYNLFNVVKILNLRQAASYIQNDVLPLDIVVSTVKGEDKKTIVFLFDRNESHDVYDKWCRYEL